MVLVLKVQVASSIFATTRVQPGAVVCSGTFVLFCSVVNNYQKKKKKRNFELDLHKQAKE